uniref:Uncharacterized protein n=1 Tax=Solanum tuberosum TaxID=4113 RepID=M1BCK7_SOLTU
MYNKQMVSVNFEIWLLVMVRIHDLFTLLVSWVNSLSLSWFEWVMMYAPVFIVLVAP